MARTGSHAVVIGASMGGLLAARALSGMYEKVTVLDRDELPDGPTARKGVPQGRHLHLLLSRGAQVLEEMFPGLMAELEAGGSPVGRTWDKAWIELGGHHFTLPEEISGPPIFQLSRPMLEGRVRARVRALPGVEILERTEATGLLSTPEGSRVTGARVHGPDGDRDIAADLVVDASGRAGRAPVWLKELGYSPAREDTLDIGILYVTRRLRMAPEALGPVTFVGISPHAGLPRALGIESLEDGTWIATAVGYPGDHPPTDEAGFDAYTAAIAPAHVTAAMRAGEPVGPIATHRYQAQLRRRYELLRRFPTGFLVFGDALCSFNPLYGQGMTVSALQARALRKCLARGGDPGKPGFARRFFLAASLPVANAWQMAVGEDLALPCVPGRRSPYMRLYMFYVRHLKVAAARDPAIAEAFLRVVRFVDPYPRLSMPDVALRMALAHLRPAPPPVERAAPPAPGGPPGTFVSVPSVGLRT